ncbi:zinc metalloprotease HtpX [Clostridium aestuarii]|uniref:Zinc metalloprotease HtpX n=1 Tax=Clostridium aestuarii TaxID=338193 RepID=A0ABT4D0G2_9CLOT|nr:zinc metalloprotease HtpX [Clostridium aestuarii]MCY6484725.1 zinc metalloprotease HtpX [Clostridium aestuarii]
MKNYYKVMLKKALLSMTLLFGIVFAAATAIIWKVGLDLRYGILASIIIVAIQFLISPIIIEIIYDIMFYKPEIFFSEEVLQFIDETCKELNISKPKIGIIKDGNPNAFTYGYTPKNARLVVTTGLLEILTEEEQKAVISHELGHIKHYDFIVMMLVSLIPMILYQIYISTKSKKENVAYFIGIGAYIVYILSGLFVLSFSRIREYYADNFSKDIMGSGEPLKSALIKIAYGTASREKGKEPEASCMAFTNNIQNDAFMLSSYKLNEENKIDNKLMKWDIKNLWGRWYEFNSTHPLTARRIFALTGEKIEDIHVSLKDVTRFLCEVFINILPWIVLILPVFVFGFDNIMQRDIFGALIDAFWNKPLLISILGISILIKYYYSFRGNHEEIKIYELLAREDASPVKGIPAILRGKIIGKGIPGLFCSEDLVIDDGTGIMLVDYRQPLRIFEFIFGVFKVENMKEKEVEVVGWYKRGMRPYFVCLSIITDDNSRICFNYILRQLLGYGLILIGILLAIV